VYLTLAAIEGVGTLAALEFTRENVAADAIARRQIVKIGVPSDMLDAVFKQGAPGTQRRRDQSDRYRCQYAVKRSQENDISRIPMKFINPRQRD
jgi:hypothetical protein